MSKFYLSDCHSDCSCKNRIDDNVIILTEEEKLRVKRLNYYKFLDSLCLKAKDAIDDYLHDSESYGLNEFQIDERIKSYLKIIKKAIEGELEQ
ncbi:unnamed protein product [Candida verbasci]|uniref:Uncharacterized protein n=1 Tax=Candida verbasci TaxID=1227364 RepID=A0A9W4U2E4_9ASCO|nr:unnamed protein product [Candida verbasci]